MAGCGRRPGFLVRCRLGLVFIALLVAACGGSAVRWDTYGDRHIVRQGETLFSIAWHYGKDHRDLARWNGLGDGSLIRPGQVIWLHPVASSGSTRSGKTASSPSTGAQSKPLPSIPSQPPPAWQWPTKGRVVSAYGGRNGLDTGIQIGGTRGQPVRAAAKGTVVYAGSGLSGYGRLIIIKHNDTYLSAYGHNESLLVREGEMVDQGQRVATMGEGQGQQPRLHFEIRRNGKPMDPLQYLPAR